jgi:CRP-like cAMP-binding protein
MAHLPDPADPQDHYRTFTCGQTLFQQGDPGDVLYIVAEGQVEIRIGEQLLETISPGGIFGEMALIDDQPRMATAIACTDGLLTPVSRTHFLTLIQRNPRFALQVMRVMADRLRRAVHLTGS